MTVLHYSAQNNLISTLFCSVYKMLYLQIVTGYLYFAETKI